MKMHHLEEGEVKEIMETAHLKFKNFSVPLTVDYGVGKNWGEAH